MASIFHSIPSCNTRKSAFLCDTNAIRVVGAPVNTRICFLRKAVECKESENGQDLKGKNSPSRELSRGHPHSDQGDGLSSRRMSSLHDQVDIKCSFKHMFISKTLCAHVFSCLSASVLLLSPTNLAMAAELANSYNFLRIGTVLNETKLFNTDKTSDGRSGNLMMMRGMTAKNFDPSRYSGRWFEVASLKRGFAGQGQEDCHCTQGVYTFDVQTRSIQVDTFCIHGGPDGYITGIRGRVQCLSEEDKEKAETDLEKQEMIREKCYLRFPTLPFIPKEPYDVIATDYDNFALVSGAKDKSFIQIYSRTPDPGSAFIEKYKSYLADFGYDRSQIKDTPQDCEDMSSSQLALMMSMSGMKEALTNQFPDLELKNPLELNPFTNIFATLKKLIELYFK